MLPKPKYYMQFKEWLLREANVMILPWPKIKKMGFEDIASDEVKKGAYLDASKFDFKNPNFEDALLNGKFFKTGSITPGYIEKSGIKHPPQFQAKGEIRNIDSILDLKKPGLNKIKINMISNQGTNRKWKWFSLEKGFIPQHDYYQITSVEELKGGVSTHYYCLDLYLWAPFALQNYPGGEPRNRPTTYGTLSFGSPIGEVIVSGRKPKTIYKSIAIT